MCRCMNRNGDLPNRSAIGLVVLIVVPVGKAVRTLHNAKQSSTVARLAEGPLEEVEHLQDSRRAA